jgi:hypothetical protein
MKYILSIVFSLVFFFGCSDTPAETDTLYILYDITDTLPQTAALQPSQLKQLLSVFNGENTHGACVTFAPITNQRFNEVSQFSWPPVFKPVGAEQADTFVWS